MPTLYEHNDRWGDRVKVELTPLGNAYVSCRGVKADLDAEEVAVEITEDQAPQLAQAILKAAGHDGWWVSPTDYTFDVQVVDGLVRDADADYTFDTHMARAYAAAMLQAADEADAQKAKAKEDPRDQAIKALDKLFAGNQSCKERASSVVGYLEAEGYTITKREDQ